MSERIKASLESLAKGRLAEEFDAALAAGLAALAEGKQSVVVTVTLDGDQANGYVEVNHKVEHRRAKPGWFKSFAFVAPSGAGLEVDLNRDDQDPRQGLLPLPSGENKGLKALNGGRE